MSRVPSPVTAFLRSRPIPPDPACSKRTSPWYATIEPSFAWIVTWSRDTVREVARLGRVHDHVARAAGHPQDLAARDATLAVGPPHEPLRDHRLERSGEHRAHLLVHVRREEVDDPVDRLRRVDGVQRR